MAKAKIRTPNGVEIEIENGVTFEEAVRQFQALGMIPAGAPVHEEVDNDGNRTYVATDPTAAKKA